MRITTTLLSTLFAENQPYGDALEISCDILLELVETKLDEGLSYLEGDNPRLARKEIELTKEFGSMQNYVREAMKIKSAIPAILTT